jgi:hypothetical protein
MIPITAVLSSAEMYDAKNAVRGAMSIFVVQNTAMRIARAN